MVVVKSKKRWYKQQRLRQYASADFVGGRREKIKQTTYSLYIYKVTLSVTGLSLTLLLFVISLELPSLFLLFDGVYAFTLLQHAIYRNATYDYSNTVE